MSTMGKIARKLVKAAKKQNKQSKGGAVVVELNDQGVQELLKSSAIQSAVKEQADEIANRAGEGYTSSTTMMGTRVIAEVETSTVEAEKDNMENNTLLKSIGGPYKKVK